MAYDYGYTNQTTCPDGLVLKEIMEGGAKSFRIYKKCVAPSTEADCPSGTKFSKEPIPSGITAIGGDGFQNRCRPINNNGYGDYGYEQVNKCKGNFSVECNDGTCDVTNGAVLPCMGRGGVKQTIPTPVNPVEKVVEAIKPKTEEEEYRNFIYLAMAGIGVYLLLSE